MYHSQESLQSALSANGQTNILHRYLITVEDAIESHEENEYRTRHNAEAPSYEEQQFMTEHQKDNMEASN